MADKTKAISEKQVALLSSRAKALNGLTTLEYSRKRAYAICHWLLRWGVSTPGLLDKVSGATRLGVCNKLIAKGLLKKTKTASGGYVRGTARFIITLTKQGLEFLQQGDLDESIDYKLVDPNKIRQDKLRHDLIAQDFTFLNLQDGNIVSYIPEFNNKELHQSNQKIVDCTWIQADGTRIALEVELSPKFSRMLAQFIYCSCLAIIEKKSIAFFCLRINSQS